jgi:prolipoprotein diacylglyceryltransferase
MDWGRHLIKFYGFIYLVAIVVAFCTELSSAFADMYNMIRKTANRIAITWFFAVISGFF